MTGTAAADSACVRIRLFDPHGIGIGLAVGLVELGHNVDYRTSRSGRAAPASATGHFGGDLARHYCGAFSPDHDAPEADLVVIVDTFADQLEEQARDYPARRQDWLEVARAAPCAAVVDMSDCTSPREVAFEQLPHVALFARECGSIAGPWLPFPFLFNNVLLWLEHLRPAPEWWLPPARRQATSDWAFCGTVEHARYGDRRRLALARAAECWPQLRGVIVQGLPFVDVLRVVQSTRFTLDLPGAGQLCFRLHESLALGTPVLRPEAGARLLAPGLEAVVVHDPAEFAGLDANAVRAVWLQSGGPRAAAGALLAGSVPRRPVQLPIQTPVACVPPKTSATGSK